MASFRRHGSKELGAELFHFGPNDHKMDAEFYLLEPGTYTLSIALERAPAHEQTFDVTGPRTRVSFTLPPRRQCALHVQRK